MDKPRAVNESLEQDTYVEGLSSSSMGKVPRACFWVAGTV